MSKLTLTIHGKNATISEAFVSPVFPHDSHVGHGWRWAMRTAIAGKLIHHSKIWCINWDSSGKKDRISLSSNSASDCDCERTRMKLLYFLKSFLKITQQLPALVKSSTRMSISSSIWAMIPNKVAKVAANAPIDTSTKGFTLKFKWGGDTHYARHCWSRAYCQKSNHFSFLHRVLNHT